MLAEAEGKEDDEDEASREGERERRRRERQFVFMGQLRVELYTIKESKKCETGNDDIPR